MYTATSRVLPSLIEQLIGVNVETAALGEVRGQDSEVRQGDYRSRRHLNQEEYISGLLLSEQILSRQCLPLCNLFVSRLRGKSHLTQISLNQCECQDIHLRQDTISLYVHGDPVLSLYHDFYLKSYY